MKTLFFIAFLFVINAGYASIYKSLDAKNTITLKGNYIIYKGKTIKLDEKNFFIDGQLSDDDVECSPYIFNSIKEAVKHLKKGTSDIDRMTLYIAPYVYWIDDPDDPAVRIAENGREPFGLVIDCPYLKLCGLTDNPNNVVLACNRGQTQGAIGNFTMFFFKGDGISLENLTLGNYCNVDLLYKLKPEFNRKKRTSAITQAQLAYANGDKLEAHHVNFISRLNSCPLNGGKRTLFNDCYFECTDDALCGTGVYLNCSFTFFSSKPFYNTSETGAIFLNCDFYIKTQGNQYFTKAENPVSLVDCRFHSSTPVQLGWTVQPSPTLRCYVFNVTHNNQPAVFNEGLPDITVDMTNQNLLYAYKFKWKSKTIYNTFNLLAGNDGWDPLGIRRIVMDAEKSLNKSLYGLPVRLCVYPENNYVEDGKDGILLKAVAKRFQGYNTPLPNLTWVAKDSSLLEIYGRKRNERTIVGCNKNDTSYQTTVSVFSDFGLNGSASVISAPSCLPAPEYIQKPVIKKISNGVLRINYKLQLEGRMDESLITWYRCTDNKGHNSVKVAVTRLAKPEYTYKLQVGDIGKYIMASVSAKHIRSNMGEKIFCIYPEKIKKENVKDIDSLETYFQHFPTDYQPLIKPGYWTVDGYKPFDTLEYLWTPCKDSWYYGKGLDGAKGIGLLQKEKGARLLYTPLERKYGDMDIKLIVDPCKTAGQGFGSATGQYMDIYIKFDTKTLSGYALRIIRTTKSHKAVDFQLVKYINGKVYPLGLPITSRCYKTRCFIHLWTEKDRLKAHVETSNQKHDPETMALSSIVDLDEKIISNSWGGIGVQHTGSTGPSASMICYLKVIWKQ